MWCIKFHKFTLFVNLKGNSRNLNAWTGKQGHTKGQLSGLTRTFYKEEFHVLGSLVFLSSYVAGHVFVKNNAIEVDALVI